MKTIKFLSAILVISIISMGCSQGINYSDESVNTESISRAVTVNKPFPQGLTITGVIKPNVSQSTMNAQVKSYYDSWKATYGTHYSFINGTENPDGTTVIDGYVIKGEMSGAAWDWPQLLDDNGDPVFETNDDGELVAVSIPAITTSEAHGYGMIVFALMAGYDPEAKVLFDKMYKTKENFRSPYGKSLMSWLLPDKQTGATYPDLGITHQTSATDGDMDIAYALLLADKQWGGSPAGYTKTYKEAALEMIEDLTAYSIYDDSGKFFPRLATTDDNVYAPLLSVRATRPSDFMIGHMDAFAKVTTGATSALWTDVLNNTIDIVDFVQSSYSNNTGLMPEFLANLRSDTTFQQNIATYEGLSDENGALYDNTHYYNACRFPWRYSMGYAATKNPRIQRVMDKLSQWVTLNHHNFGPYAPGKTRAGYLLDGTVDSRHYPYSDKGMRTGFMSALALSTRTVNVEDLTIAWNYEKSFQSPDQYSTYYYQNSINLLNMLFISGNWWSPVAENPVDEKPTKPTNLSYTAKTIPGSTGCDVDMTWSPSTDDQKVDHYYVYEPMNPGVRIIGYSDTNSFAFDGRNTLAAGITINVKVVAVDNTGQKSPASDILTIKTPAFENDIPTKPTNLVVSNITETGAKVTWTSSVDNGLMGHKILISGGAMVYHHDHKPSEYTFTGLTKNTEYTVSIIGNDNWDVDGEAATITFKTLGSGNGNPVLVPEDPAATSAPSSFSLTKDNWAGKSTYKIIANMYWGQNATLVKLYENGSLVKTLNPNYATPAAQKIEFSFTGKAKGSYVYKMEAINQHGTTTTSNFTYTVTQ